ncbi:MAG: replication-associated recombination protein A [Clostridia bacterium]|nr:replication-associated recombination protein A [Clostridia bacterium]
MNKPLADKLRPEKLADVVGQTHIIGKGKVLTEIAESGTVPNMIFYGPSGTGKTTVANILAKVSGKSLFKLNATTASVSDIRDVCARCETFEGQNGILLYLDEIQNFNKKQQQSLLEYTENGKITLIASTTENPYFYVYNAVLSRSVVFEFKPVSPKDITKALLRGIDLVKEDFGSKILAKEDALLHIAEMSNGDVRKALNALELAVIYAKPDSSGTLLIDMNAAEQCTQKKAFRYDKAGDSQYDVMSALQKSIRGSDPDAAVHYLARLIAAEDLQTACRRLMVIAAEDIGLAYPMAIPIVKACVDSALMLGLPEARIPLGDAAILLATAPKSNSGHIALDKALWDIENMDTGEIPRQLQNKHYDGEGDVKKGQGYLYPHDFPNHYVKQQYLPDKIKDKKYYEYGENKTEQTAKEYWEKIKNL